MGAPRDDGLDFLLTMALEVHDQDLLCPCGCGEYRVDSHDPDADGWYEPDDSTICYARSAMSSFQKENPELDPGTLLRVVDVRREQAPSRKQHHTDGKREGPKVKQDDSLG